MIRTVAITLCLSLATLPLRAEEAKDDVEEGFSLLEQGAKMIMRSMLEEMKPALEDMQSGLGQALTEMEPALRDLAKMIGEIENYHPPEILPNGDIILRRRVPLGPPQPGDEIEL